MPYAILRAKKLKTAGSVAAALQHNFRERETPNADRERTPSNEDHAAISTDQAMGRLRELLPEQRRKDAVLAVEYFIGASPEWFERAPSERQREFFDRSLGWLREKYGADRVIAATVQRDEKTPHLSAFVVPLTADGRLSAKEFIGNRDRMRADQSSFAACLRDLGLERGIEGSRATHQRVRHHYGQLARAEQPLPTITEADLVPRKGRAPGVLGALRLQSLEETSQGVAERLTASVRAAAAPTAARAATAAQERRRAGEMARTAKAAQEELHGLRKRFRELQQSARQVLEIVARGGPELEQFRSRAVDRLERDRQAEPERRRERSRDRGFGR